MSDYPLLNIFWTMVELFLWILWFFLLFKIITDIFRSNDLSGWGKAGWLVLVILLPLVGVLFYLIARGQSMGEREIAQAEKADAAFKKYIRDAATGTDESATAPGASPGTAERLTKLADLKAGGHLTEEEYQTAKASVLSGK